MNNTFMLGKIAKKTSLYGVNYERAEALNGFRKKSNKISLNGFLFGNLKNKKYFLKIEIQIISRLPCKSTQIGYFDNSNKTE